MVHTYQTWVSALVWLLKRGMGVSANPGSHHMVTLGTLQDLAHILILGLTHLVAHIRYLGTSLTKAHTGAAGICFTVAHTGVLNASAALVHTARVWLIRSEMVHSGTVEIYLHTATMDTLRLVAQICKSHPTHQQVPAASKISTTVSLQLSSSFSLFTMPNQPISPHSCQFPSRSTTAKGGIIA